MNHNPQHPTPDIMKQISYLEANARKWLVWITPASGVGGEYPIPIPCPNQKDAQAYAAACRTCGQRARVSAPTPQPKPVAITPSCQP